MDTGHLEALVATEGIEVVRLLLHVAALKLKVVSLEREVDELKARLKALEPHAPV